MSITKKSWAEMVRELEAGESLSRSKRISMEEATPDNVNEAVAVLRNSVNQGVSRIRTTTGRNFRVESTISPTDDRAAILCTVVVTRMDGAEAEPADVIEGDDEDVDI